MTRYHGWWLPVVDLAWRACNHRQGTSLVFLLSWRRWLPVVVFPSGASGNQGQAIQSSHSIRNTLDERPEVFRMQAIYIPGQNGGDHLSLKFSVDKRRKPV